MLWLIIFTPVIIALIIALYFGLKHGATAPDESQKYGNQSEYPPPNQGFGGPQL